MIQNALIEYLNSKNIQIGVEDLIYLGSSKYLAPFGTYFIIHEDDLFYLLSNKAEEQLDYFLSELSDSLDKETYSKLIMYFNRADFLDDYVDYLHNEFVQFYYEGEYYYIKEL